MTIASHLSRPSSAFMRAIGSRTLAAVLCIASTACIPGNEVQAAPLAGSGQPVVQGEALVRANALIAANTALSAENQPPTTFANVASLDDADVVAKAQALSKQAGHNDLYYDYFRFKVLFDKARATKADKIDIPHATYKIYPPQNFQRGTGLIEASALSHAVIDGHGATLLFASIGTADAPLDKIFPRAGIHISHSDHVVVRDLVMDWYEPLVVPVRVGGTGQPGSPQTLTVNSAFPVDSAVPIPIRGVMPYNVAERKFVRSRDLSATQFGAWSKAYSPAGGMTYLCPAASSGVPASACFRYIGQQKYAFGPTERLSPIPPNPENFLGSVRDNNFSAIVVDGGTSYATVSGITIYTSPGAGVMVINAGKAVHIAQVRIIRKPDALLRPGEQKRLMSTLADGMNVINSAGDVVIEDSEISFQADDGLNIRAANARAEVIDGHTVLVKAGAVANFYRIGGLVDIYDDKGVNLLATKIPISAVTPPGPGGGKYTVTLSPSLPALHVGSAYQVRILDWGNNNVVVRRTWFHDSTERGIVVHDINTTIVDNRFDRIAESAVQVLYDDQSGTAEGAIAKNVVIAGNRISDVNANWYNSATRSFAVPAAIGAYFVTRAAFAGTSRTPVGNVIAHHFAITDNIIENVPGTGIFVSQVDDVVLARNRVLRSGQHHFGLPVIDGNAIVVERSTHVTAEDNTADVGAVVLPD